MRGFYFIIIYSVSLLLIGCNFQKIKQVNGDLTAAGNAPIPLNANVSWSLVKTSIISNCTSCHETGKTSPDLTTVGSVRANMDNVILAVTGRTRRIMPPFSPLSQCRIAVLKKWVEIGKPDVSAVKIGDLVECQSQPGGEPDLPISQMPLNYKTLLKKILLPRCIKCHDETPPKGEEKAVRNLFAPYSKIASSNKWDPDPQTGGAGSSIIATLTNVDDPMPPARDSNPTLLTQEELNFIIKWIDAGKPE